jgi:hypothetical protein
MLEPSFHFSGNRTNIVFYQSEVVLVKPQFFVDYSFHHILNRFNQNSLEIHVNTNLPMLKPVIEVLKLPTSYFLTDM